VDQNAVRPKKKDGTTSSMGNGSLSDNWQVLLAFVPKQKSHIFEKRRSFFSYSFFSFLFFIPKQNKITVNYSEGQSQAGIIGRVT
jgi:hypothetical protein